MAGRMGKARLLGGSVAIAISVLLLIQCVPYGKDHTSLPIVAEPAWDTPRTREIFFNACRDCHSNETTWPWYASVAPASWLVYRDVQEGRSHFNVSEWGSGEHDANKAAEMVRSGEMPPWFYLPAHPEAQLSDADEQSLVRGLVATFGDGDDSSGEHGHSDPPSE